MRDPWIDRLSEYLDGEMDRDERRALEAHLETCRGCVGALADLRAIVARAANLKDTPPEEDLWPGIAERIELDRHSRVVPIASRRGRDRRFSFSIPQLAAAAIALILLGAAATWSLRESEAPRMATAPAGDSERATTVTIEFPGERSYDRAIAELERVLEENQDRLDPETVRTVEHNLALIDRAIEDTRRALAEDPDDPYLHRHLANTMERKVEVLRNATSVTRAAI